MCEDAGEGIKQEGQPPDGGDDEAPIKNGHAGTNPVPAGGKTDSVGYRSSISRRGDMAPALPIEANWKNNQLEEDNDKADIAIHLREMARGDRTEQFPLFSGIPVHHTC